MLCSVGEHPLADWTPGGISPQRVVDGPRRSIGECRGQRVQQVVLAGAGRAQSVLKVRKLRFQEQPQPGHEIVRLAELRHTFACPVLPRLLWRVGQRIAVALHDGHLVTVPGQQKRRTQATDPRADDDDGHVEVRLDTHPYRLPHAAPEGRLCHCVFAVAGQWIVGPWQLNGNDHTALAAPILPIDVT